MIRKNIIYYYNSEKKHDKNYILLYLKNIKKYYILFWPRKIPFFRKKTFLNKIIK